MVQQNEHLNSQLNPTKLHLPAVHPDHLVRQRLLDSVASAVEGPLMLVSAPAGFGKTTFATQWVRTVPGNVAWVSLEPDLLGLEREIAAIRSAHEAP